MAVHIETAVLMGLIAVLNVQRAVHLLASFWSVPTGSSREGTFVSS